MNGGQWRTGSRRIDQKPTKPTETLFGSPPVSSAAMEPSTSPADEATVKAVHKRYEGLLAVRNKAIRGKGAWYWAHLEPLLINSGGSGTAKAVKLRCCLCNTLFSASNPSRTASEHLKRGTCPHFSSTSPRPISTISPPPPPPAALNSPPNHRKRPSPTPIQSLVSPTSVVHHHHHQYLPSPAPVVSHQHLLLSGGKDDLAPLAMLEDSVKRLKSPKTSPGPPLSKTQVDFAVDCLSDWVYESFGSVSISSLDHPKFKLFLNHVGLPAISGSHLLTSKLDSKLRQAKSDADTKIRDATFFQIAADGWKTNDHLVGFTANLPNGTSVFTRAVFTGGCRTPSTLAEEILWETVLEICGSSVHQCVGIVADKFKNKALWNLENQHHWMVNLICQYQGFVTLIKDFYKNLPMFINSAENCRKLANFINSRTQVRKLLQNYGHSGLFKVFSEENPTNSMEMVEDVLSSAKALQSLAVDESFKIASMEDPEAREFVEMIRSVGFWNDLDAVSSIVKIIKNMADEIESEKPLVGQCLPLWNELRIKIQQWCIKFQISETLISRIVERRFAKNYHPAWAAAYILDPLYLVKDPSGKYLPPFKNLTNQQEKDVDKLVTRLVSREEAHVVLMELMKWRAEGLDPVYAQAVQLKQRDAVTGKLRAANPHSSRLVWETYLGEFRALAKVAVRVIFLHATARGVRCGSAAVVGRVGGAGAERLRKMAFIAANSRLERRDFRRDEEKDAEVVGGSGEEDVMNGVFAKGSPM